MTAHHILVPLDFSDYANYALDYAIALADTFQARLTLLHILHLSPLAVGDMPPTIMDTYLRDLETEAQHMMQASLERVESAGLEGESVIAQGIPFQLIIDTARDRQIDLIIMGTHGRTGLTHALIGSVAEKVVRLAPCPVLVTRGQSDIQTP